MESQKDKYRERLQRWQKRTNRYITTVNSTILALSIGMLGYFVSSITRRDGFISNIDASIGLASIAGLIFSCYFGVSVMINRLNDFRGTIDIIKRRIDGAKERELEEYRKSNSELGNATHKYLDRQVVLFAISSLGIILLEGFYILKL